MARMSNEQIKNLTQNDINNMTVSELARVTTDLQAIAKKRYQRLTAKGLNTNAVRGINKAGGFKSLKGATLDEVRAEFNKANIFVNKAKTSTFKGAKQARQKTLDFFGLDNMTDSEISDAWEIMHKLCEDTSNLMFDKNLGYSQAKSEVAILIKQGGEIDDKVAKIRESLTTYYEYLGEEQQAREREEMEQENDGFTMQFTNGLPFTF